MTLAGDGGLRVKLVAEQVRELLSRGDRCAGDGGVVHDTAQPVRDDRCGEGQAAVGDAVRGVGRLPGRDGQIPSVTRHSLRTPHVAADGYGTSDRAWPKLLGDVHDDAVMFMVTALVDRRPVMACQGWPG